MWKETDDIIKAYHDSKPVGKGNALVTVKNQASLDRIVRFSIELVKQKEISSIEQGSP